MKVVLITGSNKGIGYETARQMASLGFQVIMSARNKKAGQIAAHKLRMDDLNVDFVALDVTSEKSIAEAVKFITKKYHRLDVLINNAGIQLDKNKVGNANTTLDITMDELHKTFDTNFFGMVSVTKAMMPLLKKSESGRIVNVSSILGSVNLHSNPESPISGTKYFAYNASKTAVNMFTIHLADALNTTKIKVNSAHPGWVKTSLGGANAVLETTEGAKTLIELATLGEDGPTGSFFHMGNVLPW